MFKPAVAILLLGFYTAAHPQVFASAPAPLPISPAAQSASQIRYEMLTNASIDGYPNDDDIAAISRYLTVVGDKRITVPDDIAKWIGGRLGHLGPAATPRMVSAYMHFLRAGAIVPPFDAGLTTSTRYYLLNAIANDLSVHGTPLANLALLMFKEINDSSLSHLADAANYQALESYPWLLGNADWMNWVFEGLNPDSFYGSSMAITSSPAFPLVTDKAKAAELTKVQQFIATLNIASPVSSSLINFRLLSDPFIPDSWARIKYGRTPDRADQNILLSEYIASDSLRVNRIAATLGIQPPRAQQLAGDIGFAFSFYGAGLNLEATAFLLRPAFGLPDPDPNQVFDNSFTRLVQLADLQQYRLLALGSYALFVYQQSHTGPPQDIAIDQVFAHLAAIHLNSAETHTKSVAAISQSMLLEGAGTDLSLLSGCSPMSLNVISRVVSIPQRRYLETLKCVSSDNKQYKFERAGTLSVDFARMLEINESYFDITNTSLALRDLTASQPARWEEPQDIDLIRASPQQAGALLLGVIAHPQVPWTYFRDALLQYWPPAVEWFTPGWRPKLLDDYHTLVANELSSPDFTSWSAAFAKSLQTRLEVEAQNRFINGIIPAVNAMPTSYQNCDFISHFLSFGGSCGSGRIYTSQGELIKQINDMKSAVEQEEKNTLVVYGLTDPACSLAYRSDDWINTVISVSDRRYTIDYELGDCDAVVTGKDPLPQDLFTAIDNGLKRDPILLSRYQLDLMQSADGSAEKIKTVLTYLQEEPQNATEALAELMATDDLYYLPSIAPPAGYRDMSERTRALAIGSPLTTMIGPLLKTAPGQQLAADLLDLRQIFSGSLASPTPTRLNVSDAYVAKLRDLERNAFATVNARVDENIADANSKINPSIPAQFSFGFSVGVGENIVPGFFFNYQGDGFNISLDGGELNVAPIIKSVIGRSIDLGAIAPNESPLDSDFYPPLAAPGVGLTPIEDLSGSNPVGPDISAIESDGATLGPSVDWSNLLSATNPTGRGWLESEINIARPSLTTEQLSEIKAGEALPSFPSDLAKLIATKATKPAVAKSSPGTQSDQPVQLAKDVCAKGNIYGCGLAAKQALDMIDPKDLQDASIVDAAWSAAYDVQFDALREKRKLVQAVPTSERIEETLNDNFNPANIASDAAKDKIMIAVVPKLAFVIECANAPVVAGLKAFFDGQEVGTTYDDIRVMNDDIQSIVIDRMKPFMKADWNQVLIQDVDNAAPAWKMR